MSRRRQRRELGRSKNLTPNEIDPAILDVIKLGTKPDGSTTTSNGHSAPHVQSSKCHRRSFTVSPQHQYSKINVPIEGTSSDTEFIKMEEALYKPFSVTDIPGRTPSLDNAGKYSRLTEVSKKMDAWKERTKSQLASIELITAKCNNQLDDTASTSCDAAKKESGFKRMNNFDGIDADAFGFNNTSNSNSESIVSNKLNNDLEDLNKKDRISIFNGLTSNRVSETPSNTLTPPYKERKRSSSTEERIIQSDSGIDRSTRGALRKKSSVDACEINYPNSKKLQYLRRKSSEEASATNHIVSILKKKDHNESSSASSNASPVTFSSSVVDTPTRSSTKQGILKKRSSLDESRYSRSHSPDERSILVRTPRRNSLEEIQHIGILKQRRSYDSKADSSTPTEPHSILKKKETSTPSEVVLAKHVSISEAVILAAAELCKDAMGSDGEHDIRPILKQDTPTISTPRPILKKK